MKNQIIPTFVLLLFSLFITAAEPGFPAHWWQEVDPSDAPSWEVLPQEAGAGEVILESRG